MRSPAPLALALVLGALATAAPPPLLVPRAACAAERDAPAWRRAAGAARAAGARALSPAEACGEGWLRAALGALGAGGALGLAGGAGASECGALQAAARALGRAAPARCWRAAALAAGAAALARALGWRRAALGAATGADCTRALREAERALRDAGVQVRRATPSDRDRPTSEVAILCVSREVGGVDGVAPGAARALLLDVDGDATAPPAGVASPELLLLLGPPPDEPADPEAAVSAALREVERAAEAEARGEETARVPLRLRERAGAEWRLAADLQAAGARRLDAAAERRFDVRLANLSGELRARWREAGAEAPATAGPLALAAGGALLAALAGALLAALAGALLAAAARRRVRPRARCSPLLSAADFTFPADERRVGDGIETMLSCWLRRLHEFGAPAPAAGARLAEPAPRASSLPSSTCSVNRVAVDRRTRYKGDPVRVEYLRATGAVEPRREAVDALLTMQSLRHENLNPFVGWLPAPGALVWALGWRGSLEDVLREDDIRLDWTFRLSLLTDLVKGMRYLHASPLRVHGRLTSRACVVDSRWVLRVSDYGLPALARAQPDLAPGPRAARELLWTAPELLRDEARRARGSQAGDVFSFAIVMQEVIVRGEPYCMLSLSPEELVEKLTRPPPLIRPSVSLGAAPPEAVSVMRQCWSEAPEHRPDFHRLHDTFRRLHRGRKINIVDSMFEMLEKYSDNLEELVRERTEQLDTEKRKTEQLLNRMLPRTVAERLLLGGRVEPEEFSSVSIYFSDIVGFTELAARSSPVQVVDLLNDLYSTFDAAIERYRVYKVETIGDAYMVVSGLPQRADDHAEQVASMALHLLHLAGRFRPRHRPEAPLLLRIGLHSGPVCAGVVGLTMPRYCLFGDTVNTASRMESTGAAWRVQLSASTARRLAAAGGYRLRPRGLVHVKGKGAMRTHWLLGKDGFDEPLPTPPPLDSEELLPEEADGEDAAPASPPAPPAAPGPVLRRQWSLERGEELAQAAAARPQRYRTRPSPPV